jgi:hypothetical protein
VAPAELWKSLSSYNNGQLLVALAIVVIIALSVFARYYLAPGTLRQAALDKDRDDAVGVLKAQLALKDAEIDEKDKKIGELDHANRNCEQARAGFEWMKTNPDALRLYADQIEQEQRRQQQNPNAPQA